MNGDHEALGLLIKAVQELTDGCKLLRGVVININERLQVLEEQAGIFGIPEEVQELIRNWENV